jgi:hypothetical protein
MFSGQRLDLRHQGAADALMAVGRLDVQLRQLRAGDVVGEVGDQAQAGEADRLTGPLGQEDGFEALDGAEARPRLLGRDGGTIERFQQPGEGRCVLRPGDPDGQFCHRTRPNGASGKSWERGHDHLAALGGAPRIGASTDAGGTPALPGYGTYLVDAPISVWGGRRVQ